MLKKSVAIKTIIIFALSFMLIWMVNCTSDTTTETVVKKIVTPEAGGTILGTFGTKIIIPPNAVKERVEISAYELVDEEVPANGDYKRISIGLVLEPMTLTFEKTITIEMSFLEDDLSVEEQAAKVRAFGAESKTGTWEELTGTIQADHMIWFKTKKLGIFSVFKTDKVVVDGDKETETESDVTCDCTSEAGNYCLDGTTCKNIASIVVEQDKSSDCKLLVKVMDDKQSKVVEYKIVDCDFSSNATLTLEGGEECELGFNQDESVFELECKDCKSGFKKSSCK